MSDALYAACAEVLALCQSMKDDLAALLDPETGFAPRMRQICRDQITEHEDSLSGRTSQETIDLLRLEQNTWSLLQALIPARKTDPAPTPSAHALLLENPYTPTSTLAQAILNASPLLTELLVVREWLHDTAPPPPAPEANTGYWKFTKHSVLQALRTGAGAGAGRSDLVREMDPDALGREEGRGLAGDDASYEKSLHQALYAYVRAGRLDDAVELCRRAHQPWRAASIRGSFLFQWRAISTEPKDEDPMMMDSDDSDDPDAWSGNPNRKLWKSTCMRVALDPTLPPHERLLSAALAPTPQTAAVLRAACKTWEDHLWALVSTLCEAKESAELGRLGAFWEGGMPAVVKRRGQGGEGRREEEGEEGREKEEEEWETEVREGLEKMGAVDVTEGPGAQHAFHTSQLLLIQDRTSALLDLFAGGLANGTFTPASTEYASLCRFFAHLCLFLQMVDTPVPPMATQFILEAYLRVLEDAGQRDLIALYAGALGDNAVERYAMFLVSLALSADVAERRLALTRARDHGLDMERVAIATAERTIEKAFEMLPQPKGPLPSIIALQPPASETELFLLRSIEWTIFMDATYPTALEQANVILRYFLTAGRVQIAEKLLDMLPPELAAITEPEEKATEYLHYRQFFAIWDLLARAVECQAKQVQGMAKDTRSAWVNEYRELIDTTYEQIVNLLTSEWLATDEEVAAGGRRRERELIRIREMYIPELVIRLHFLLYASRHVLPENLKRTMELVNIVADSRYNLYEDFDNADRSRLGDYLGAVRQAVLGGVEGGGSDPFRVIACN